MKFHKKAQGMGKLWLAIAYLGLVIFIGLTLMFNLKSISEGDSFLQNYYSKDISLAIETVTYAPGEIVYNYPLDTSFSYSITEGNTGVQKDVTYDYPFTKDFGVSLSAKKRGELLVLQKTA